MTERYTISPKHPNANIHGVVGPNGEGVCLTPDGTRCSGCCALPVKSMNKEAGFNCPAHEIQTGCLYVIKRQNGRRGFECSRYHCSADRRVLSGKAGKTSLPEQLDAWNRLDMINNACLQAGEIDKGQYTVNQTLRVGKQPKMEIQQGHGLLTLGEMDENDVDRIAQALIDGKL